MTFDEKWTDVCDDRSLDRRGLVRAAASGFVLAASGLLLPAALGETEAREGALGGDFGGRRGKNRRGRHKRKRRNHGNNKGKSGGGGLFRATALTIRASVPAEINNLFTYSAVFYYRPKTGLDAYGPWQVARDANPAFDRFAADHYRVGVLLKAHWGEAPEYNLFVDVRNRSFNYPRGAAYDGFELEPRTNDDYFQPLIAEQNFGQGDNPSGSYLTTTRPPLPYRYADVTLQRTNDSSDFIEFQVFVNVR